MLTANRSPSQNAFRQPVLLSRQIRIRGGSRETEAKALTVTPTGTPFGVNPVTTVTPVAKVPRALRNCRESNDTAVDLSG